MKKIEKTVTEYEVDKVWSIVVERSGVIKYHLLNKMAGTSKVVQIAPDAEMEDIDTVVEQMIKGIRQLQEDMIFDNQVNPKHMVDKMAGVWKTCQNESEFITNVTYMILGIMVKAYNDMEQSKEGFKLSDSDVNVSIMTSVHKVGETLMSVEHKRGSVNVASNNQVESLK